jgi:DNA-binding MarR family transcriptional regulator
MATVDVIRKFARQAIPIEHILGEYRVSAKAGRVVLALALTNKQFGVPQGWLVEQLALPKYAVSKLVKSLVKAGLFSQSRDGGEPRSKTLMLTEAGKEVLRRVQDSLRPSLPRRPERTPKPLGFDFGMDGRDQELGFGDLQIGNARRLRELSQKPRMAFMHTSGVSLL